VARTDSPRARLFVALELPTAAREALVGWQSRVLAGRSEELRALAPEALHVTLAFLGSRPEDEIPAIGTTVDSAVDGLPAAELTPLGCVAVPRRRPRLFAIDLSDSDGRAGAVQAAVSDALAGGGFYEPERRPFWPHVTVARVRRGAREVAPLSAPPPASPFEAAEVVLYRSHLSPRGARYEALERAELTR
jgi:RNA 2',3'-cyclic 3'-phosphodiesterase